MKERKIELAFQDEREREVKMEKYAALCTRFGTRTKAVERPRLLLGMSTHGVVCQDIKGLIVE